MILPRSAQSPQGLVDVLVVFNASQDLDARQLRGLVDMEVQRYLRPDQLIIVSGAQTNGFAKAELADE